MASDGRRRITAAGLGGGIIRLDLELAGVGNDAEAIGAAFLDSMAAAIAPTRPHHVSSGSDLAFAVKTLKHQRRSNGRHSHDDDQHQH